MTKYKDGGRYIAKYNGVQQAFTYYDKLSNGLNCPRVLVGDICGDSISPTSLCLTDITELTGIRAAKVGDIVIDSHGCKRKVLTIDNQHNVFLYSYAESYDSCHSYATFNSAEKSGWKLKTDKPKTTLKDSLSGQQIENIVNRFLGWHLPKNFSPDGGITYDRDEAYEPVGTNLLDFDQADSMIRYILKISVDDLEIKDE